MSVPCVTQRLEKCPHGCGASIGESKKYRSSKHGRIKTVYQTCEKCGKNYSVRFIG